MGMKSEDEIRDLVKRMDGHAVFIKDDFRRYGFDNFLAALGWVLND